MTEKLHECPVCGELKFSSFLDVKDYFLTQETFSIQKCDGCEFKFINPRPDDDEIGRYYQSDEYISHDSKRLDLFSRLYKIARMFSIKRKYKIVVEHSREETILDIGCGTGEFLHYCRSKGFAVEGVEPNGKASVYAQKINGIPVTSKLTDLFSHNRSYGCITMWHVLEHIHLLNETLSMVKCLLSTDGILIVAVPNSNSWDANKFGKFWAAYDVPRHLYHFNKATLSQIMTNHGFEIRKVIPQTLDAFYISMLSEKYRSGRNRYFKSFLLGLWSNMRALKQNRGYSSEIFVLSVKKA
jgi:2-polyprenyl-3-methyl-5-hydroxy-6-metoxy-1,4-benzoquinol methylase